MAKTMSDFLKNYAGNLPGLFANKISQSFPEARFAYQDNLGFICYPLGDAWPDINFPMPQSDYFQDVQRNALIYLSDDASFRMHFKGWFSGWKNRKFNSNLADGLNHLLGEAFDQMDYEEIWFALGRTENQKLAAEFLSSKRKMIKIAQELVKQGLDDHAARWDMVASGEIVV